MQQLKARFMSVYDVTADGRLQIQEVRLASFNPHSFIRHEPGAKLDCLMSLKNVLSQI